MKTKKLKLDDLSIKSFITIPLQHEVKAFKGGVASLDFFRCPVSQGGPSFCIPIYP